MLTKRSCVWGLVCAVFVILFPMTNAWAKTQSTVDDQQLIAELLDRSGVSAQLNAMPWLVKAQLEQQKLPSTLDQKTLLKLINHLNSAFDPQNIQAALSRQFILHYDKDRYRSYLTGLDAPVIRRLTQMEIAAATDPESSRKMSLYLSQLEQTPASKKRIALIRALDQSSDSSNFVATTQASIYRVIAETLNYGYQPANRLRLQDIDEQTAIRKQQSLATASQFVINNALYVYRDASDEDLQAYVNFHHTEAAAWFHSLLRQAWIGSIRDVGRDVAWRIENETTQVTAADDDFLR
ncbi:MAG: hypothetical protein HY272_13060 [Gammaproteobacteria bacterium]|nr:hypothetical protein [Gammaproteobacteria bacterium]